MKKPKQIGAVAVAAAKMTKEEKTSVEVSGKTMTVKHTMVEELVIQLKDTISTHNRCYMLSFNIPSKQKVYGYQVVNFLLDNIVYGNKLARPVRSTFLFIAQDTNVSQIQTKLRAAFPVISFVLVRVNRQDFPAIRYGNPQLQIAINKLIAERRK